jgi:RNA polymerase sigma-70 factor (ECF subfamily)
MFCAASALYHVKINSGRKKMADSTMGSDLMSRKKAVDADEELISAAKDDVEAFGRLYDRYYEDIFRYIYGCTFDHALTEDSVSNTFFAALRHIRRYKWKRIPFGAWLHKIAMNEIRMHLRKQKQVSAVRLQPSLPSAYENPVLAEEYAPLHQAITKLKPMYRDVIIMRFFEDKAIPEICRITGRKEGTVRSRLHRGLKQLRDILMRHGVV